MTTSASTPSKLAAAPRPAANMRQQNLLERILISGLAVFVLLIFLMPLGYMFTTGLKSDVQMSDPKAPVWWPFSQQTFTYNGEALPVYKVPTDAGVQQLAAVKKTRVATTFVDPANPAAGEIVWEGNWRTLEPAYFPDAQWNNFLKAWNELNFPLLFRNTLIIAIVGTLGAVISSVFVAYGFARFNFTGKNALFMILIGTIILPVQATLIPTYIVFARIGWTNTFLPLIVPHFFANAYNVFLLRQFFLTLPRELDEAAMIDGAGPFRILLSVIIPQSWPAIISVGLFHFIFAWNDYFGPLLYLLGKPELQPISVGVQVFNFQYGPNPELIQATSLMAMVLPLLIFVLAQKIFMRGVVITGVDK